MKHIAVLLTVFNRKAQTLKCLSELQKQSIPEGYTVSVYLTNDGCTDGTPEAVREQFPSVNIIDGDGTLFWNRGMWTAWDRASKDRDFDFYLWLNDDTNLYECAISELVAESEKHDTTPLIVVGATKATDSDVITYGGRIGKAYGSGLVKHTIAPCNGKATEIMHFNGNIVLVNREAFRVLGNLDPYFTHSRGDFDYGLRARKAGVLMLQCGKVLGECDLHPTMDKWCDPEVPLKARWKMLHRPNGMPPNEIFYLEKRHYGIAKALFHYLTIHVRCLFPSIWTKLKS